MSSPQVNLLAARRTGPRALRARSPPNLLQFNPELALRRHYVAHSSRHTHNSPDLSFLEYTMADKPLSDILAKIDPSAITVDSRGRIKSADPKVTAQLEELAVRARPLEELVDANGVQCFCSQ